MQDQMQDQMQYTFQSDWKKKVTNTQVNHAIKVILLYFWSTVNSVKIMK